MQNMNEKRQNCIPMIQNNKIYAIFGSGKTKMNNSFEVISLNASKDEKWTLFQFQNDQKKFNRRGSAIINFSENKI